VLALGSSVGRLRLFSVGTLEETLRSHFSGFVAGMQESRAVREPIGQLAQTPNKI